MHCLRIESELPAAGQRQQDSPDALTLEGRLVKLRRIGTFETAAIGILVAVAMPGPAALPQEPHEAEATEEIIVTRSRLAWAGIDSLSPVIIIGADAIRSSTVVTLGDVPSGSRPE